MPSPSNRRTKNDIVYTTNEVARRIIEHFNPKGFCLDPCMGMGAFYDNLPEPKDYCEIAVGRDFLEYEGKADWVVMNPPWSSKALRPFARKAYQVGENVVSLIRLHNGLGTTARIRDMIEANHRLKEIIVLPWEGTFHNKDNEGFALIVVHSERGYTGECKWTYWI